MIYGLRKTLTEFFGINIMSKRDTDLCPLLCPLMLFELFPIIFNKRKPRYKNRGRFLVRAIEKIRLQGS